jgi:hypothetical protein
MEILFLLFGRGDVGRFSLTRQVYTARQQHIPLSGKALSFLYVARMPAFNGLFRSPPVRFLSWDQYHEVSLWQ